jgi:hypothetical protein
MIMVPPRNAEWKHDVYADVEPAADSGSNFGARGRRTVQTAQPRDVAALALVVGVFLILFIVSVMLGAPNR